MTLTQSIKQFVSESYRVLRVTKKPTNIEFQTIVKVSGLGIAIIGLIGFFLQLLKQMIMP